MKISVNLEPSEENGHQTFDLEDLELTEQQWNNLSDEERKDAIQNAVNNLHEHPYWVAVSFEEL